MKREQCQLHLYELMASYSGPSKDDLSFCASKGLDRNDWILAEYLDLDFGLLNKLVAQGIVSGLEFDEINGTHSKHKRVKRLMSCVGNRSKVEKFYTAVENNQQTHVVNYAKTNGQYRRDFGTNWPLTEKQRNLLYRNREILVELLEILPKTLDDLCAKGGITQRHKEYICSIGSRAERNKAFLDILRRRSFGNYKDAIECLRESNQLLAADILEGEGVVGRIQYVLDKEVPEWEQRAFDTVEMWNIALNQKNGENEGLGEFGLRHIRLDEDIILYFYFKTMEEVETLNHSLLSGELRTIVERQTHWSVMPAYDIETMYWKEDDYSRCIDYFQTCSSKQIADLYKEVMEIILAKSFALSLEFWKQQKPRENKIFKSMASICHFAFKIVIGKSFKRIVSDYITPLLRQKYKRLDIIRINRDYLLEQMHPSRRVRWRLLSADCLTFKEFLLIKRLRSNRTKCQEMLHALRSMSTMKHSAFVEVIHSSDQERVADLLERGGVSVRVKVTHGTEELESMLTSKLKEAVLEWRSELETFMTKRHLGSVKIIGIEHKTRPRNSKGIVLWLWCATKADFRLLQSAVENDKLDKTLAVLFHIMAQPEGSVEYDKELPMDLVTRSDETKTHEFPEHDILLKPKSITVDIAQFQKEVVIRSIVMETRGKLNFSQKRPLAVTSLLDEIYVLFNASVSIYNDQPPFDLRQTVTIPPLTASGRIHTQFVLSTGFTITPCQMSKCVYFSHFWGTNLRRLTAGDRQHSVWLTGIENMLYLFTTSKGQVLIFKQENTDLESPINVRRPALEIYDSEANLVNRRVFPPDFGVPLMVAEISRDRCVVFVYSGDVHILDLTLHGMILSTRKNLKIEFYNSVALFAECKFFASTPKDIRILDSHFNYDQRLFKNVLRRHDSVLDRLGLNGAKQIKLSYSKAKRKLFVLYDSVIKESVALNTSMYPDIPRRSIGVGLYHNGRHFPEKSLMSVFSLRYDDEANYESEESPQ